ncbi:hypothetical protein GCM10009119_28470 [Algoriphagus jejuensis]|uniref:Methyltransferase type 11 domain-containing protein n=1 Tax=Algoriphagus jejuensis TaxID=419934 RepID=A0ABN1N2S8_9BACT
MSDAYGFLAPIYQPLSRLVFGKDLIEANQVFSALAYGKNILILGGGDGMAYRDWDGNFFGEYWDTSSKMADLARRNLGKSEIKVNLGGWPGTGKFDAVFLPFVLDSLPDEDIQIILSAISNALKPGGKVVLSDFFPPKTFLQSSIQKLMISGFRTFAKHPRTDLPDFDRFFSSGDWRLLDEKTWRKGWIRTRVYGRMEDSAH